MRLKVQHITTFEYAAPVYETATEVRLRPSEEMRGNQRLLDFDLKVEPYTPLFNYTDYFGNCVYNFYQLQQHDQLKITSTAIVETGADRTPATAMDEQRALDYLNPSRFVLLDDTVAEFVALENGQAGQSTGTYGETMLNPKPLVVADALARKVNSHLTYETGVTDVYSDSAHVLSLKRGVCQDFAHVLTAACRYCGVPARYVSGYLYGGVSTEGDDRESHAWCEIYTGQQGGWVALDPTHDTINVDERYIKIGVGRDYSDVTPIRGTFKGASANEKMHVVVRVSEA